MTVMPRIPSRKSKVRRSSFVAPTDRVSSVPDALSWRKNVEGESAPKGPAAWSAASSVQSDRAVVDAGPYGVIDLAVMEPVPDLPGPKPQLGVVWWDKRSLREEDDDEGTIQTSFVPASLTDHVSLAGSYGSPSAPRASASAPASPAAAAPDAAPRRLPPSTDAMAAPAVPVAPAAVPVAPAAVPTAVPVAPAAVPVAPAAPPQPDDRPRQAGDHASLAAPRPAEPADAAPLTRRANRERPAKSKREAKSATAASPVQQAPQAYAAEPIDAPAPPVAASRHPELDESEHRRHARRSRHVELVPKTRGRRGRLANTSHPRRAMLRRRRTRRRVVVSIVLVVAAFLVTLVVQNLVITPFSVPSSSMENTLHTDDRILVNKFAYGASPIHRGDVVVFEDPGGWLAGSNETTSADGKNYLVKRVVGVPGDHVTCCSTAGRLTVNGTEVYEPYAVVPDGQPAASTFDVTVPAGELWVLGDNRYNSRDSSQTQDQPTKGFVPIDRVVGQAVAKLWPLNQIGPVRSSPELASIADQTCPT
ncbi:signal peptidase I [Leifsonia sp. ku-ls]|nr:signal peptidase I [Leifsonia sp. ku-ls]